MFTSLLCALAIGQYSPLLLGMPPVAGIGPIMPMIAKPKSTPTMTEELERTLQKRKLRTARQKAAVARYLTPPKTRRQLQIEGAMRGAADRARARADVETSRARALAEIEGRASREKP